MSDQKLPLDPNAENATNDVSGAVTNDEEMNLDAPLPPDALHANQGNSGNPGLTHGTPSPATSEQN